MRKVFRISGIVTICFSIFLLTAILSGCGKKADESAGIPPEPPATSDPSATAPPGGVSTAPGGPGSTASAPGAQAIDSKTEIAFKDVPNVLGITTTTVSRNGVTLAFHKFKYTDWKGNICQCEMPTFEAEGKKTTGAWLSTFDIYKKASTAATKKTAKKSEVKRLHDFPFVSPPPGGQTSGSAQPGGQSSSIPSRAPSSGGYSGSGYAPLPPRGNGP